MRMNAGGFREGRGGEDNELSSVIIGRALKVHKALGPGLLESAYEACLFYELAQGGLNVERQKGLPLVYQGVNLECGYRVDLFVENRIIIELKAVESISSLHTAQTLTYLKLSHCKLGLIINFNVLLLKDGIRRVVNNF
jgi:GxxExxY protein